MKRVGTAPHLVATPETWFRNHVIEHAPVYFPDLEPDAPIDVHLLQQRLRPASQLFWFRLARPGSERQVIVKMPRATAAEGAPAPSAHGERPRFGAVARTADKYVLEYSALQAIDHHFGRGLDPRFGSVHPYELLPSRRALVMEAVAQANLKQLLETRDRSREKLRRTFNNAGAWLRSFHGIRKDDHVEERHTTRDEFVQHVFRIIAFLEGFPSGGRMIRGARARLQRAAKAHLPVELPLGIAHGDYALRNVLVDQTGRVTIIDTLARWRTCVFEDIGTFLVDLKHGGSPLRRWIVSTSRNEVTEYEAEFLRGYFGQEIPDSAVRLYEFQALLDRWAAQLSRRVPRSIAAIASAARAAAIATFLGQRVRRAVRDL